MKQLSNLVRKLAKKNGREELQIFAKSDEMDEIMRNHKKKYYEDPS